MFPSYAPTAASLLAVIGAAAAASPSATVSSGTVVGAACAKNTNAVVYKSIPFAAPPTGDRRFLAPEPYTDKYPGGTLDATKPSPICVQFDSKHSEGSAGQEDCLYLDVWAPANATADAALPVRVWLYGGSNVFGGIENPLYDGCNVAADAGALQVSLNYRLGPLGFLAVRDSPIVGNQAIQDMVMGLQWVQDNIAAFGGDPKKVVLHGQSAGAFDAYVVATLPQAPKLISAAIFESGAGRDIAPASLLHTVSDAYTTRLNCTTDVPTCLRTAPLDDLYRTFLTLPIIRQKKLPVVAVEQGTAPTFKPYVDGTVIPRQPSEAGVQVPSVYGINAVEGALFSVQQFPKGPQQATAANYTQFLTENFPPSAVPLIQRAYPLSSFNTTPYPAYEAITTALSAAAYVCPAGRGLATAAAHGTPVFTYRWAHVPSCPWLSFVPVPQTPRLGATHTAEVPFVFGILDGLVPPNGTCDLTEGEHALGAFFSGAFTRMAATQMPGDAEDWPAWMPDASLGVNIANTSSPGKVDYSACALWDRVYRMTIEGNGTMNGTVGAGGGAGPTPSTVPTGASSRVGVDVVMGLWMGLLAVAWSWL